MSAIQLTPINTGLARSGWSVKNNEGSWNDARDRAASDLFDFDSWVAGSRKDGPTQWDFNRGAMLFDLSIVAPLDCEVSLELLVSGYWANYQGNLVVVSANSLDTDPLNWTLANYATMKGENTEISHITEAEYQAAWPYDPVVFTFNAAGNAYVKSKAGGLMVIGFRSQTDIENDPPPTGNPYSLYWQVGALTISYTDRIYVWLGDIPGEEKHELTDPSYSKVLSARTERGRDQELGQAQTGIAEVVCDNLLGDFSPENISGHYYGDLDLGKHITIFEVYKGVKYDHFRGKIDKILPHGEKDNATAYITALDGQDDMAGTKIITVLRSDTETGELCDDVLDAIGWPVLDRVIDTGVDTLQYGWFHKISALEAIKILEQVEKGFFYISEVGKAVWENRHHRLLGAGLVSQAYFVDTMVELGYEYSKRAVKNKVTVAGRRYFSGGVTLWSGYDLASLDSDLIWSAHCGDVQAPYIPQATTVILWADWNQPLATYTNLVKGEHWNANTKPDKTGSDVSNNITITETQYGQAIKLEIANAGSMGAYLVVPDSPPTGAPSDRTLLIYGALFSEENVTIMKEDVTSRVNYGMRSLDVDARFKSNPNDILAYAEFLLARFKDPVPDAVSVKFVARTAWPDDTIRIECLQRKISDRISLRSTLLGFDRDFFINKVIQEYVFKEGGFQHETTWYVERAEGAYERRFWLLGIADYGELGEATYLGV